MSAISGLANLSPSLRVDAGADASASMRSASGVAKALPIETRAVGIAGGDCSGPYGSTFDFDVSRLLSSKTINGDNNNSMAFLGGSLREDSSRAHAGNPRSFTVSTLPELGTMNSFAFGGVPSSDMSRQLDLLALHQNMMLEDQFRRRLLSEVMRPTHALGFLPNNFGLGSFATNDSNEVGGDGQSSMERFNTLLRSYSKKIQTIESQASCAHGMGRSWADILSCPPIKMKRPDGATIAVLLEAIPKRHRHTKHSFPVPSSKRSRKVRVQDLTVLRARWRKVHDRGGTTARTSDRRTKEAFDKELFARSFARRGNTNLEGRYKEVAGNSALHF
jgi:hypothetical protein